MKALITVFILTAVTASAQFSFPPFLPSECRTPAESIIPGATDTKIVTIACVGTKYMVLGTELDLGLDLETGKAAMWVYIAHSNDLDTTIGEPYIRPGGNCTMPPVGDLDSSYNGNTNTLPVPATFVEGQDLINNLKANTTYTGFHAAYPDSTPTVVAMYVTDQEVFGFPEGTPMWTLTWSSPSGASPFVCIMDALSGQTICIGQPDNVNGEDAARAGYTVYPNPAYGSAMLNLPLPLLGAQVHIEAVDITGRKQLLTDGLAASIPMLLDVHQLSPGMWSIVITSGTTQQVVPLVVTQ